MQVKTCPATIKAAGPQDGLEEGVVEAIVATYDVDSIGDQIMPGAFAETLAEWKSSNDPIPFLWSHKSDDPDAHIGVIEEAEERPGVGLWVKARIDMDEPPARRVYKLLKGRRVRQYSFAYDELDARPPGEKSAPGARKELHRLKLYEAGPTPIGCNQNTATLDVKSVFGTGRVLRKGHGMTARDLRTALDSAVSKAVGGQGRYVWVRDYTDDWVAYSVDVEVGPGSPASGLYRQSYTVNDGVVTLAGSPIEVVERTEYVPASGGAFSAPDTGKAAADAATKISDTATDLKAGRILSKQNEDRVAEIARLAQELLASVQKADEDPSTDSNAEKATPTAEPATAPAPEAKSDEPAQPGTASERLRTDLTLAFLEAEVDSFLTEETP